jgi:nucleoside-diphosphate-sugar epimerase
MQFRLAAAVAILIPSTTGTENTMNRTPETALVIGMSGGFGAATARALLRRGFNLRALSRHAAPGAEAGVSWVNGDALNAADVMAAARGATVIVHAAHPAGYRNWREHGVPMLANSIAAARHNGATLLFPGNIYNFGPDAGALLREDSPQRPLTRKGAIRVAMEHMLADASRAGLRALVLRCGDFFGPGARSSWFSQAMVRPGKPVRGVPYPGPHATGHAWAYLPDVGEAAAALLARRGEFAAFESFHFGGHWLPRGVEMAQRICEAAGLPHSRIGAFPWWAIHGLSPLVKTFREMLEMRYLWQTPLQLDNRKLVSLLGTEPHTPLPVAVRATLESLGCVAAAVPRMISSPAA